MRGRLATCGQPLTPLPRPLLTGDLRGMGARSGGAYGHVGPGVALHPAPTVRPRVGSTGRLTTSGRSRSAHGGHGRVDGSYRPARQPLPGPRWSPFDDAACTMEQRIEGCLRDAHRFACRQPTLAPASDSVPACVFGPATPSPESQHLCCGPAPGVAVERRPGHQQPSARSGTRCAVVVEVTAHRRPGLRGAPARVSPVRRSGRTQQRGTHA